MSFNWAIYSSYVDELWNAFLLTVLLAIITMGSTPYDREAAVKLDGDVEAELQAVVAAL